MLKMNIKHRSVWAVVLLSVCVAAPVQAAVRVGQTPKIQMQSIDGKAITNESLQGQIVIAAAPGGTDPGNGSYALAGR